MVAYLASNENSNFSRHPLVDRSLHYPLFLRFWFSMLVYLKK